MVLMYFEVRKFCLLRVVSPAAICKAVQYQRRMMVVKNPKKPKNLFWLKGASFVLDPNVEGETKKIRRKASKHSWKS